MPSGVVQTRGSRAAGACVAAENGASAKLGIWLMALVPSLPSEASIEALERRYRVAAGVDEVVDAGGAKPSFCVPRPSRDTQSFRARSLDRLGKGRAVSGVGRIVAAEAGERGAARLKPLDRFCGRRGFAVINRLDP